MQAFKAANPGCRFGEFEEWRGYKSGCEGGWFLDPGGQEVKSHILKNLWESVDPVPAKNQKIPAFFEPAMLAERILDYLETIPPRELLTQLARVALLNASVCMKMSEGVQMGIEIVKRRIEEFEKSIDCLNLQTRTLRQLWRRFAYLERDVSRASSLAYCLPSNPNLVHELLQTSMSRVSENERMSVAEFFAEAHSSRRSGGGIKAPSPSLLLRGLVRRKEYVFQLQESKTKHTSGVVARVKDSSEERCGIPVPVLANGEVYREYVAVEEDVLRHARLGSRA